VDGYGGQYGTVALVLLVGVLFLALAFGANRVLRPPAGPRVPTRRPVATYETYECGVAVDPADRDWAQTSIRYYVYAFVYVVFAVESVFVFPWATVFSKPGFGLGALLEMGVFVAFLALGLLYAWRKRVLTWD
jgi:NADH-quinone oxidoreductase subunit A